METAEETRLLQLRLRSCIELVIKIQEALAASELMPELGPRFESLKEALLNVDSADITENDVRRVETATNNLLEKLQPLAGLVDLETPPPDQTS